MKRIKFVVMALACIAGAFAAAPAKAEPIWQLYFNYPCSSSVDTAWYNLVGNGNSTQANNYAEWGGAGMPVAGNPTLFSKTISGQCYGMLTWLPNPSSWLAVNDMSPTGNCPGTPSSGNPCTPTVAQIIADLENNISPPVGQTWATTDMTIPSAGTTVVDVTTSELMVSTIGYAYFSGAVCRYGGDPSQPSC